MAGHNITVVDGDSMLYAACYIQQITKAEMTHIPTGRTKLFESKTDFNNWLKLSPKWNKEDFTHTPIHSLQHGEDKALDLAVYTVGQMIDKVVQATQAKSYTLILEGEGNFRMDKEAKYVDYKGQRGEKPLLFSKLKERIVDIYSKKNVLVLAEGVETDDLVCMEGWRAFHDPCGHELTIAYKDKDIVANTVGNMYNYGNGETFYNTQAMQHYNFCIQLLMGDSIDSVGGLVPSKTIIERYKLRLKEGNTTGKASATALLKASTEQEYARFILSLYQETYGEQEGWERLDEAGFFLYLLHYPTDQWNLERFLRGEQ